MNVAKPLSLSMMTLLASLASACSAAPDGPGAGGERADEASQAVCTGDTECGECFRGWKTCVTCGHKTKVQCAAPPEIAPTSFQMDVYQYDDFTNPGKYYVDGIVSGVVPADCTSNGVVNWHHAATDTTTFVMSLAGQVPPQTTIPRYTFGISGVDAGDSFTGTLWCGGYSTTLTSTYVVH